MNEMHLDPVGAHRLPVVTIRFATRAGSADEPAEKAGLANLTLEAMRRGTERRNADALEQAVAATGGESEGNARRDELASTRRFLSRPGRAWPHPLTPTAPNTASPRKDTQVRPD